MINVVVLIVELPSRKWREAFGNIYRLGGTVFIIGLAEDTARGGGFPRDGTSESTTKKS